MKTLSVLKKDLEFNKGLTSLIETLKTIAVSQYRTLEQRIKSFKEFVVTIESFFDLLSLERIEHPFLDAAGKSQAVVAITSDTGLLGGLNAQVIAAALRELEEIPGKLIVIGECGKAYVRETSIPFVAFGGIIDEERQGQAMQLRDYIITEMMKGAFGYLKVVYPHPVSFTVQRVETVPFLPFTPAYVKEGQRIRYVPDIIMESHPADCVGYLVYLWMGQRFYEIFGWSRLAEFAARFTHLEECTQRLKDMYKKVQLQYFKARHELIDRNMRELFAARSLYASLS